MFIQMYIQTFIMNKLLGYLVKYFVLSESRIILFGFSENIKISKKIKLKKSRKITHYILVGMFTRNELKFMPHVVKLV